MSLIKACAFILCINIRQLNNWNKNNKEVKKYDFIDYFPSCTQGTNYTYSLIAWMPSL